MLAVLLLSIPCLFWLRFPTFSLSGGRSAIMNSVACLAAVTLPPSRSDQISGRVENWKDSLGSATDAL